MRKLSFLLAVLIMVMLPGTAALAEPAAVSITAKAAVLMDAATGTVLFEKDADEKLPVASITKIMTLLLIFEAMDTGRMSLNDTVTVSQYAASMGGSQVLLDAGGSYSAGDLIKSIIVASANDASVAMAEHICGTEAAFVEKMNERAGELGMNNTLFTNCNGLPNENEGMSARDVAIMSRELLSHEVYFQYSKIWLDELTHEGGRTTMLTNTNKLIRSYEGCDGVKTGFTNAAGFCLSASARRGDTRLIAVVLGGADSKSRFCQAEQLLNLGFSGYETLKYYEAGEIVEADRTLYGREETFHITARNELCVLHDKNEPEPTLQIDIRADITPPLLAGEEVGKASLLQNGQVLAETALVIDRDLAAPGFSDYWRALTRRWTGCEGQNTAG